MSILNPLRDPQTESPAAWCERCRQEVYSGECRYLWEGKWICPDCFRAALDSAPLDQLAAELSLEVERYQ